MKAVTGHTKKIKSSHKEVYDLIGRYLLLTSTPVVGKEGDTNHNIAADVVYKRVKVLGYDKKQLEQAFENGLKDDLNRQNKSDSVYSKLCGADFIRWVNAYHQLTHIPNQVKAEVVVEVSQDRKEEIFQEALKFCISRYQKTKEVLDYGSAIYRGLWARKMLVIDEKQWGEYLKASEQVIAARLEHEKKLCLDRIRRLEIDRELGDLMEIEPSEKVKVQARLLALKEWIDNYLKNEKQ